MKLWRRKTLTVEQKVARARALSSLVGTGALMIWTFGVGLAVARGDYFAAIGNSVMILLIVLLNHSAKMHRQAMDAAMALFIRGIITGRAMQAMHDGTEQRVAVTMDGECASCGQKATSARNGFLTCMSGHRVHLECLTHEDEAVRCPLCLRRS
jgi:hypothetical protein